MSGNILLKHKTFTLVEIPPVTIPSESTHRMVSHTVLVFVILSWFFPTNRPALWENPWGNRSTPAVPSGGATSSEAAQGMHGSFVHSSTPGPNVAEKVEVPKAMVHLMVHLMDMSWISDGYV